MPSPDLRMSQAQKRLSAKSTNRFLSKHPARYIVTNAAIIHTSVTSAPTSAHPQHHSLLRIPIFCCCAVAAVSGPSRALFVPSLSMYQQRVSDRKRRNVMPLCKIISV